MLEAKRKALGFGRTVDGKRENSRFSPTISVIVLVVISCSEIFRIRLLNLLVRHIITNTRVDFVKCLPLQLIVLLREEARSRNSTLEGGGPDSKVATILLSQQDSGKESRLRCIRK